MKDIYKLSFVLPVFFLGLTITAAPASAAAIYKCVSKDGKTYFNDKPCPVNNAETEFKAVKDPVNGYIPPEFVPKPIVKQNSGVVIGEVSNTEGQDVTNTNGSNDVSTGGNNNTDRSSGDNQSPGSNQSSRSNLDKDNGSGAAFDETAGRTAADEVFNQEMKDKRASSQQSDKTSSNVTIIESFKTNSQ